jgi:hypothetical protein
MLLYWGVAFVAVGVLSELLGGTLFRSFFNWKDYPPRYPKGVHGNVHRINTIVGRVVLLVGLAMTIIGLVIEIVSPT